LKNINLKFEKGKTNLIIGQSGSGKTVLLKSIIGLHTIDSGEINFDDRDFTKMKIAEKQEIRKEMGMVFQGGALFDSNTVLENVMFPLSFFSKMSKKEMLNRARFCLDRVNLKDVDKLYPSETSGGMQKRIAIARAISLNPKYLFCDEPNSGLDPQTSIVIDNLIREITVEYNMTTVINTHDMNSVMEIGDTVAYIHKGECWWTGSRHEILNSNNKELNAFVFAGELMKRNRKQELI